MQELVAHLTNMFNAKGRDDTRHAADRSVSPFGKKLTPTSNEKGLGVQRAESFLAEKLQACLSNKERSLSSQLSWKSAASDTDGTSSPIIKADYSRALSLSINRRNGRARTLVEACKLVTDANALTHTAKGESKGKSTAGALLLQQHVSMHEYPVLFVAAVANTMLQMVEVCIAFL
jgi:hypothetical protein